MLRGSGVDGRPLMIDVGRLADVSAQTVSRYFNGGYVGAGTRERIEGAVAALGYRRHAAARQLKSNRADVIGVIAMGPPNFGLWSILEGMTTAARQAGFTLVIGQLDIQPDRSDSASEIAAAVDQLLRAGVDGVVVGTPLPRGEEVLDELIGGVPVVVISERPNSTDNSVRVDSYRAGTLAMDHLLELGHRRILHLEGDPGTIEAAERRASYEDALQRFGLSSLPSSGRDWTAEAGWEIGRAVDANDFTAVFAANDALASGFMSAMRARGLHAPRDYSIVGIDNMPDTRFYVPPLTTVNLDFRTLGEEAIAMMLRTIRDGSSAPQRTLIPELVQRESTARIRLDSDSRER